MDTEVLREHAGRSHSVARKARPGSRTVMTIMRCAATLIPFLIVVLLQCGARADGRRGRSEAKAFKWRRWPEFASWRRRDRGAGRIMAAPHAGVTAEPWRA